MVRSSSALSQKLATAARYSRSRNSFTSAIDESVCLVENPYLKISYDHAWVVTGSA